MSQLGGMRGHMGGAWAEHGRSGGLAERRAAARAEPADVRRRRRAGGSVLGSLADVYANPVMVEALILGREGTIGPRHRLLRAGVAAHR